MIGRHKFASGVGDSGNTALVLPSDWNAEVLLGWVMTNRTGGTLTKGDVVAVDTANNDSVVLADTQGARRQFVVFVSAMPSSAAHTPGTTIANLDTGIFLPTGTATVAVAGATTRGNYLRKSAATKALEDMGVAASAAPPVGALATALQGSAGAGSISAIFHGWPMGGLTAVTEDASKVSSTLPLLLPASPATPAAGPNLAYRESGAVAAVSWTWNGSSVTVTYSFGVSSVTRNGTGDYIIAFARNFASVDQMLPVAIAEQTSGGHQAVCVILNGTRQVGQMRLGTYHAGSTLIDFPYVSVVFFGNRA